MKKSFEVIEITHPEKRTALVLGKKESKDLWADLWAISYLALDSQSLFWYTEERDMFNGQLKKAYINEICLIKHIDYMIKSLKEFNK